MRMPPWTLGVLPATTVGTCGALALGGYGALGLDAPLAPAFAQSPGQTIAMILRVVLLFAILWMPADTQGARRHAPAWGVASVGAVFLLSLVARGALALFVLCALGDLAWLARRQATRPAPRIPWLVLAPCLALLAFARARSEFVAPGRGDARSQAFAWRARGNLWRTRWYALAWARTESPPGEAYMALAEANWDLGRRDKARHVVAQVLTGEPSDADRHRAEAALQLWNR